MLRSLRQIIFTLSFRVVGDGDGDEENVLFEFQGWTCKLDYNNNYTVCYLYWMPYTSVMPYVVLLATHEYFKKIIIT